MSQDILKNGKGLNRRDFLRYSAGATVAITAMGILPGFSEAAQFNSPMTTDFMKQIELQDGRTIDFLTYGFPGGSPRGTLGWASVMILRGANGITVVDTGQAGDRPIIVEALKKFNINPQEVTKVFITHFHYDHINNVDLFPKAVVVIGAKEMNYVKSGKFEVSKDPYVPKTFISYIATRKVKLVKEGDYLEEGIRIIELPGHTPGVVGLLFEKDRVLIAGDALKNPRDLYFMDPGMCFDSRDAGIATLEKIKKLAKMVIPGHDAPFLLDNGEIITPSRPNVVINHFLDWKKKGPTATTLSLA